MSHVERVYQLLENELGLELRRLPDGVTFERQLALLSPGKEFAIFGAGMSGQSLQAYLARKGCKVIAFIDNNSQLDGTRVNDIPVYSPQLLGRDGLRERPVLIASMHYHDIARQLSADYELESFFDYHCIHQFLLEDNIMGQGYGSELIEHLAANYDKILATAELWDDRDSRWRFFRYLYLRLYFLTPDYLEPNVFQSDRCIEAWAQQKIRACLNLPAPVNVTMSAMLQENIYDYGGKGWIGIEPGDHVVDGGAWLGDSTLNFAIQATPKGKVWAFEPDANKCRQLIDNLEIVGMHDIVDVVQSGLWSTNSTLSFSVSEDYHGAGSFISESGGKQITVSSLDQFLKQQNTKVDFIKLDIEGSELEAMKGAEQTIREQQPKLAICLYHKMQDPYEIPLYLKSLNANYRIHFKHRGVVPTDAILFAAPRDR